MAKNSFVIIQFVVGELVRNQMAIRILRIITFNFWKHLAERRGEFDQRLILLRSEIVLDQIGILDVATDWVRPGRSADKIWSAFAAIAELRRDRNPHALGIFAIPVIERIGFV